jgi:hypothetical protein
MDRPGCSPYFLRHEEVHERIPGLAKRRGERRREEARERIPQRRRDDEASGVLVPGLRRHVSMDRLNPVETRSQNPASWAAKWSGEEDGYWKARGPRTPVSG